MNAIKYYLSNNLNKSVRSLNKENAISDSKGIDSFYTTVFSPTIAHHNITKYNEKSECFDEEEEKYKSIFQSINIGIIVVADYKGNITEWNKGAALAFGYSKLEILGRPLTLLMSKKFRKGNIKELLKAIKNIKGNQNVDIVEMCCLRKNGEQFPVEFALSSWNVAGNGFYCAMMLDITKRKALEYKLKQKTKDLELFLYRSAHDLKAPFSSAEGLLNLLKEEDINDRMVFLTNRLETTIKRGKVLVDNLTQASLMSSKNEVSEQIDFNTVLDHVLNLLSGTKNLGFIKIDVAVNNAYEFNSNPELLSLIFQNLIQNAIKYSMVPTEDYLPCINIEVKALQNEVIIKISDNGQGIAEKSIKKIYDLYYRANKENTLGNGLGLYIVKNCVNDLKGKISVKSEVNRGTCFEIVLPNSI